MAKKSTVKVRLVPEEKTDSKFYYYAKKPTSGLKAKDKLRMKKYNPATKKHEWLFSNGFGWLWHAPGVKQNVRFAQNTVVRFQME